MNEPDTLLLVHTTCADADQARRLAAAVVDGRLAACASVGAAVGSTFPWDDTIQHDQEIPVTFKTTLGAFDALERAMDTLHPYDVPELLAVPVVAASADYAAWVRDWVAGSAAGADS
ncbi:divalent-cation tolerance protein CutA [Wenzhouxiangella sp. XN79A]|uniref:divalent-cation tolerance protein CutA n=1 Tax=Wenzhouxiangella sp. XN79A TaxID=2724193 RepID=UPI00144AECC6|nr:divalent-cation tolerance protein CutA [Wenzhouxiangella sp. XN79A]NKI33575.1 divalent-cation tolerance protein CutA [Wenzhouxiangella sp. XN79A]